MHRTILIFIVILDIFFWALGATLQITQNYCQTNFYEENITLTIDQGTLVGKKSLDYGNDTFYSFEGIPYAKPPIDELRFKPPEPPEKWCGIYNATKLRPVCPQIVVPVILVQGMEQSEDCLFLNVHSKMSNKLKPVMVFYFGGSFQYGSIFEARYGPELFMTEDIVLVLVSYRLNVFGFSALDDPIYDINGNMGFKDQVLALKWVQKNIHHFGGDPNTVTIFGQSSGATSVNLLYLSPIAKGLFHRAIAQSGSAENIVLCTPNGFIDLADDANCSSQCLDKIIHCLSQTNTENLITAVGALQKKIYYNKILKQKENYMYNVLTIEKKCSCQSFLNKKTDSIVKKGEFNSVPMIMGFNTDESVFFANTYYVKPNFTDYRVLIPPDIKVDIESKKAFDLGKRIKELYYEDQIPSNLLLDPFFAYLTDLFFVTKIYKYAKLQSSVSKTYFYQFNYYTKLNQPQNINKYILHAAELSYLFYQKDQTPKYLDPTSEEFIAVHRMIKLWTTFAKTGDPNPVCDPLLNVTWFPIESNKFNYLKIQPNLELCVNPLEKRMHFWEDIYTEFNCDIY